MQRFDVLIIGAGIVGCACALECARSGMKVGVVEASEPGSGATGAGMGHVVVMDDSPAQLALTQYSRTLWQALAPQLPESAAYEQRGTVWVAADEEEMQEVHAKSRICTAAGIRAQILDEQALAEAEPNLRKGLAGGLLVPDDAVLYAPAAAVHFLHMAMQREAKLISGNAVSIMDGRVTLQDGTQLAASQVVAASGADTSLLPWMPIQKRKGHLVITDKYPDFAHHQLVELGYLKSAHSISADSVAFNIQPRRNGQMLIGSSRQYGDESAEVNPTILHRMLERAESYMPELAKLSRVSVRTGFRAATPDKLPLIGPTAIPGLFLATGFEGLGITTAPGAARLLADHLLHRKFSIDPAPYLPGRFQ